MFKIKRKYFERNRQSFWRSFKEKNLADNYDELPISVEKVASSLWTNINFLASLASKLIKNLNFTDEIASKLICLILASEDFKQPLFNSLSVEYNSTVN